VPNPLQRLLCGMVPLALATHVWAATAPASPHLEIRLDPERRSGVIVEFHETRNRAATMTAFRRDLGGTAPRLASGPAPAIRHQYVHAIFGAAVTVPSESIEAIRRLPYVRAVHVDRVVTTDATRPARTATTAAIDAAARVNARSLATRGEGIRVGVIDTGIDYMHPALGGGFGTGRKVASGWDFVNDDADPRDDFGHGTHVAGIIAADSEELRGVAPAVTLFAYKVLNAQGRGMDSDVLAAIERSIDPNQDGNPSDHLDVINISLGGPGTGDDLTSRAADNAAAAGVIVVAAAGNAGMPGSVGSPGTARTAITVGALDRYNNIASFSSRGPTPGVLEMKPDVLAPGMSIVSSWLGGILIPSDGTSMAAPHVAGVAALLKKLHPEWTPAEVKSALVSTALAVSGSPVERAAGRIDATRADAATTFLSGAGISFGLASAKSGAWEAVRTVTVTNRAAVARTFDVAATNVPAGATLVATPATLQLAPGESKVVELRLALDGAVTPFAADPIAGGDVEFRGAAPFALPWCVVRAARITVSYDQPVDMILALSTSNLQQLFRYELGKGELFAPPDSVWDFVVMSFDRDARGYPSALRLAFEENRTASGDTELTLHRDDASAEVILDSRDEHGTRFTESPEPMNVGRSLRFLYPKQPASTVAIHFDTIPRVFLSPVSSGFRFQFFEAWYGTENARAYNVQHERLDGITATTTLTAGGSSYKRARIRFPAQRHGGPNGVFACQVNGIHTSSALVMRLGSCASMSLGAPMLLDYFTTTESGSGASGLDFDMGMTAIATLRGIGDSIVPSSWPNPSPAEYRIADGEEVTLGSGAMHPFAFFGTAPNRYIGLRSGFSGPLGEWYPYTTLDTAWTAFNAEGAQTATGTLTNWTPCDEGPCDEGPAPVAGGRYVATRSLLPVAGRASRGELDVRFGSDVSDLIAPTITTLRIVNGEGRLAERFERNAEAAVLFSATDLAYVARALGITRDLKREATRVSYRIHGTTEWHPVSAVWQSSNHGAAETLNHFPAGELWRADLSAATRSGAEAIDLRIEIEDVPGNRSTWTQAPAFAIGTATAPAPGKRRSVR
jgi:subtilisin family serine protease